MHFFKSSVFINENVSLHLNVKYDEYSVSNPTFFSKTIELLKTKKSGNCQVTLIFFAWMKIKLILLITSKSKNFFIPRQ